MKSSFPLFKPSGLSMATADVAPGVASEVAKASWPKGNQKTTLAGGKLQFARTDSALGSLVVPRIDASNQRALSAQEKAKRADALFHLKKALPRAEERIAKYFGLVAAKGSRIDISLYDRPDNIQGSVRASVSQSDKRFTNLTMRFNLYRYSQGGKYGDDALVYFDRLVAHELTHAVMFRSLNAREMFRPGEQSYWFLEGLADFIHGGDMGVRISLGFTPEAQKAKKLKQLINDGINDQGFEYSVGYLAVRYLHYQLNKAFALKLGPDANRGIKQLLALQKYPGPGLSLSGALNYLAKRFGGPIRNYTSVSAFLNDFRANGAAFAMREMSRAKLVNADTGAIGGSDVTGRGPALTAASVIPSSNAGTFLKPADPLIHFNERFV